MQLRDLVPMIGLTLRDPSTGLRSVLRLPFSTADWWQALLAVVAASTVLTVVSGAVTGLGAMAIAPMQLATLEFIALATMAAAIHVVGRGFSGRGRFGAALAAVVWLQVIMLAVQLVQMLLMTVAPAMAALLGIGAMVLLFYLLARFIREVQGYASAGPVVATVIAIFVAMAVVLGVMMGLLGVDMPELANV